MSLADLLNQATPGPWPMPKSAVWFWCAKEYRNEPMERFEAQAALIALAPDMARLLIDMADAVALARGYIPSSEQFGALDINALLARFADLNAKAGGET